MTAAAAAIAAKSAALTQDAGLAAAKGASPDQQAARRRVAELFCSIHLPTATPDEVAARIAALDLGQPVQVVNAAGIDTSAPPARGFWGVGKKPQYLVSKAVPPKKPDDPVYALKSFPAKN